MLVPGRVLGIAGVAGLHLGESQVHDATDLAPRDVGAVVGLAAHLQPGGVGGQSFRRRTRLMEWS